ncbi:MAG: hypothetical protein MUO26_10950 [Methanotrichaceae archaeon]|nr:hypothetical protein [Methanotrichaceae archaeon]
MKVTTARDPSVKARRLAKAFARFLSVPYVTRGKQSLSINNTWLVVVESYGNPSGLIKRIGEVETRLDFSISIEPKKSQSKQKNRPAPVIVGYGEKARSVAEFLELGICDDSQDRSIVVSSGELVFMDSGQMIIKLKI